LLFLLSDAVGGTENRKSVLAALRWSEPGTCYRVSTTKPTSKQTAKANKKQQQKRGEQKTIPTHSRWRSEDQQNLRTELLRRVIRFFVAGTYIAWFFLKCFLKKYCIHSQSQQKV
jgi:hypothetical protein